MTPVLFSDNHYIDDFHKRLLSVASVRTSYNGFSFCADQLAGHASLRNGIGCIGRTPPAIWLKAATGVSKAANVECRSRSVLGRG